MSDNEEEEAAFSAVERTSSQQQQSIEYTDNDANDYTYTNSYHSSSKMMIQRDGDKYVFKR